MDLRDLNFKIKIRHFLFQYFVVFYQPSYASAAMIDVKVLTHKVLYQLMSSHLIILPVEFPSKGPKFQTQKNKEVWSCWHVGFPVIKYDG